MRRFHYWLSVLFVVLLFETAKAEELGALRKLGSQAITTLSPDGNTLASWSPEKANSVDIISTESGKILSTLSVPPEKKLKDIRFGSTNKSLSSVTTDGTFLSWQSNAQPQSVPLEEANLLSGITSSDKSYSVVAHAGPPDVNGFVGQVWDTGTGKLIHQFKGKEEGLIVVSPDGKKVFLFAKDGNRFWDSERREELPLNDVGSPSKMAIHKSPNFRFAAFLSNDRIWVIDTLSAEYEYIDGSGEVELAFTSSSDNLIVSHGNGRNLAIEVWSVGDSLSDLAFLKEYAQRSTNKFAVGRTHIAYQTSRDGYSLTVQNIQGGEPIRLAYQSRHVRRSSGKYKNAVACLRLSDDGSRCAIGMLDGTLSVWTSEAPVQGFATNTRSQSARQASLRSGSRCLGELQIDGEISTVDFIGDNYSLLVGTTSGQKYLAPGSYHFPIDAVAGIRYRRWETYGREQVNHVDFSPDGKMVAVALDQGLSVIDSTSGAELDFFPQSCFLTRFDETGKKVLAVGSRESGIADLQTKSFSPIKSFGQPTRSPDGKRLLTGFSIDQGGVLAEAGTGNVVNYFKGDSFSSAMQYAVSENREFFMIAGRASKGDNRIHFEVQKVVDNSLVASIRSDNTTLIGCHVFSDGKTVLLGTTTGAVLYDLRRRRVLKTIPEERYRDDPAYVRRASDSIDAPFMSQALRQATEGQFLLKGHEMNVQRVTVNEASGRVLFAEPARATMWDIDSGNLIWTSEFDSGRVASVAISSDGNRVAIGKEVGDVQMQRLVGVSNNAETTEN